MPTVTVRYFAVLREVRGTDVEQVEIEPGTTVKALFDRIFEGHPEAGLPVAFARNLAYARPDEPLAEGDEVGFLPPLGGG